VRVESWAGTTDEMKVESMVWPKAESLVVEKADAKADYLDVYLAVQKAGNWVCLRVEW
jgi:hypothetical protein